MNKLFILLLILYIFKSKSYFLHHKIIFSTRNFISIHEHIVYFEAFLEEEEVINKATRSRRLPMDIT